VPVPPTPDDRRDRALLILLLLAREAGLAPDQVDGPEARTLVGRGLDRRRGTHRTPSSGTGQRPWTCPHRWSAA
jgi:hypothetical protein